MDMEVMKPIITVSHGNSIVKCSPFPPGPPTVILLHPINYVQFVWGIDPGELCQPVTLECWYGVGALAFRYYHPLAFQLIASPVASCLAVSWVCKPNHDTDTVGYSDMYLISHRKPRTFY